MGGDPLDPLRRELRAVVDDRPLAVLGGIDADRVAAAGWAFGAFTAGLTGVLLAPYVRLDPYGMPLLVMEVVAVAVAARMRSLPSRWSWPSDSAWPRAS